MGIQTKELIKEFPSFTTSRLRHVVASVLLQEAKPTPLKVTCSLNLRLGEMISFGLVARRTTAMKKVYLLKLLTQSYSSKCLRTFFRSDVNEAKALSKKLLTAESAASQQMTIGIQLPKEQRYLVGDCNAFLPTNHKDNVYRVMKYFELKWDSILKISGINSSVLHEGLSISTYKLLTGYIGLTQPAQNATL